MAHVHIRYLNPFPHNLGEILGRYKQVMVAELNGGQLAFILRGSFATRAISYSKLQGRPFKIDEVRHKIDEVLG